ncbi:MAG TPA: ABC transporter substrate-binding protein [Rhodanobacteraceae bacterium]|nr:ABC transporter substrate-binding protein [Rhodanobacteraceae bacterium]
MDRRTFIGHVGGVLLAAPLAVRAQQAPIPVIGFLNSRAAEDDPHLLAAFRQGLKEVGYIEGQNMAIEYRFAEGQDNRLPALAADLVRRGVVLIAANGLAAQAAKAASATIPIVFTAGFDPVAVGLVASMSRPGGNITGVCILDVELGPKRLELLRVLVPAATTIAVLVNPADPARAEITAKNMQAAARDLRLQLHVLHASADRDFDAVFASLVQLRAGGLVIGGDPFFNSRAKQLGTLALRQAVPTIYQFRTFAAAGGLASYGTNLTDSYRLMGVYTGRVLRGEKPGDLPIQQPTKVELIVNLRTAKALGLTIPPSMLARADEVIR